MANTKNKIKRGMCGSRNGRGRCEYTEILKIDSKKIRRRQDKQEIKQECDL
jgi:phosphoenolpyruvate synthase/pyruvate phosphate dikinase